MEDRWQTMTAGKFDFGFAVDWMRKDLGIVLDEARRTGARLPLTALVDQFYADVQASGNNRWDTASPDLPPGEVTGWPTAVLAVGRFRHGCHSPVARLAPTCHLMRRCPN